MACWRAWCDDPGEIFRQYGPAYREKMGTRLSASQRVAMAAIEQCRTEALDGQVYTCPSCCGGYFRHPQSFGFFAVADDGAGAAGRISQARGGRHVPSAPRNKVTDDAGSHDTF